MKAPMAPIAGLNQLVSLLLIAIIVGAAVVLMQSPSYQLDPDRLSRQAAGATPPVDELTSRFQQAVMMLHAKEYEHAITALHRVIQLAPRMPEAFVNMGYALLGLERYRAAGDFFMLATDLNPYQANAYWGLAVALENSNDLEGAVGAMRTFIHLTEEDDPFLRRARSALWEWESTIARGPLPEHEKEFIERGMRQWQEKNLVQDKEK